MKIEALSITKSYGSGSESRLVLDNLCLSVEFPHVLALLGPSGSGKSTLLRIIAGLERPDAGSLLLNGEAAPLCEKEPVLLDYRRKLGVVFQAFNLFPHMTAFQNVMVPLTQVHGLDEQEATHRTLEVMERLGMTEHGQKFPSQLSGGQRQRIAIARALASKARFLLFDEPTSSLDPEMTAEVLMLIAELKNAGTPMLLVTHELGFAYHVATRVIFLADGAIHESGTPDAVLKNPAKDRTRAFLARYLD